MATHRMTPNGNPPPALSGVTTRRIQTFRPQVRWPRQQTLDMMACGFRTMQYAAIVLAAALLSACASSPPRDSVATAVVWRVLTPDDLQPGKLRPEERRALLAAPLAADDLATGRVVGLQCAMMTDGWWNSLGLLPQGMQVRRGDVVRLQVEDQGDNDRTAFNRVLGLEPGLLGSMSAYRAIPDWRERGLLANFERVPLSAEIRSRYLVVQGSYLIRCKP